MLLLGVKLLTAQTLIRGRVTDKTGVAIPGANIYLDGTYDGSSSNLEGSFEFFSGKSGPALIKATFVGYNDFTREVELAGEDIELDVVLTEAVNRMQGVVITAGSFDAGSGSKSEVLRALDIVTTAGVTADIAGALNTLPGTQTVGEEGRLFVRGGDGYETTTFIDGAYVLDSYDQSAPNVPTRSRFSPFMFSGTSFSTGGYSAEYGQGLSSALILNTKDKAIQNRTDFSFITVGLEAAHTQVWENSSLTGKLGYFNLDPYYSLIKQDFDWLNPPTSLDGNLAWRQNIGNDGMLKAYGKFNVADMKFNYDSFTLPTGLVETRMQNAYTHLNTSYSDALSPKWLIRTGASYTVSNERIQLDQNQVKEKNLGLHLKAVGGYVHNDRLFINLGGELISREHSQEYKEYQTGFANIFKFEENIFSSFTEVEYYFTNKLTARLGQRLEYNSLSRQFSFDPRFSLALQTGNDSQLGLAYGRFRQSSPKEFLRVAKQLSPEQATHYILNYQVMKNQRTFRIEGYWKEYEALVTFDPKSPHSPESYMNHGQGYARGIDLFFRDAKTLRNVDYWLSYSFLDTEREYRDYPHRAAPTFSSRHNFSAVYKQFIDAIRTQIGLTYSFASGRPYNNPNNDGFNNERTPAYHDLSTNVSWLVKSNIIVYASLTNLLKRDNIFGYEYRNEPNEEGNYEGRAITQPAPRFLLVGLFITLSKNKTTNQLPNL